MYIHNKLALKCGESKDNALFVGKLFQKKSSDLTTSEKICREIRLDVKSSFRNRDLCPDILGFTFLALKGYTSN